MSGPSASSHDNGADIGVDRDRRALEGTDTGVWAWDVANDVIHWSEQVGPLHGLPPGAQPNDYQDYLDRIVHPDDRPLLDALVKNALAGCEDYTGEFRVELPDGSLRWLYTRAHVVCDDDGGPVEVLGLTHDVTELRRREESAALLDQASVALAQSLDPFRTLRRIARLAVPDRADWCSVHVLREDGQVDTVAVAHIDPEQARIARALASRFPPDPGAADGAAKAMRTGRAHLYANIGPEELRAWARDEAHLELLMQLRPSSTVVAPLLARGRALGAISFHYAASGRSYSEDDVELAEELGRRAGVALDHARLYERRHRAAATLQRALLPSSVPQPPGYELAPVYLPATEGDEACGDWYDAFPLPQGRLGLVIGDVVGHGIEAAATMGQLRNALRAYALVEPDPARVVDLLSDMAHAFGDVSFATATYATLELETGELCYASAGHLPPLLIGPGDVRFLEGPVVPPLATLRPVPCTAAAATLNPGETLVLYTDGLVERRDRDLDSGMARVAALAAAAPAALGDLMSALVEGMDSENAGDDVAMLAIRRQL